MVLEVVTERHCVGRFEGLLCLGELIAAKQGLCKQRIQYFLVSRFLGGGGRYRNARQRVREGDGKDDVGWLI